MFDQFMTNNAMMIGWLRTAFAAVFEPIISIGTSVQETAGHVMTAAGQIADSMVECAAEITSSFSRAWAVTASGATAMFSGLTSTATTAWAGITAAFATGDWAAIWNILKVSAQLAWLQIVEFIEPTWNSWKDSISDTFTSVWTMLRSGFHRMWGEVKAGALEAFASILSAMANSNLGIGPLGERLRQEAAGMRTDARNTRLNAASEARGVGLMPEDINAWFAEQMMRVERDTALEAGDHGEANRLSAELATLVQTAQIAAMDTSRWVLPSVATGGDAGLPNLKSMILGGFNAQSLFGLMGASGGSSDTPLTLARQQAATALRQEQILTRQEALLRNIERVAGARVG
jgi:hypothetical protein